MAESLGHSVERVLKYLRQQTQEVSAAELIAVTTTAAGSDRRIGSLVADAIKRAGKDGVITVETAEQRETTLEVQEGMVFDRGYLSEYFVTDPQTLECVLENCLILLYQPRIQSMKDLLPLLEQVAKIDKSLLIIADNVEGEALATLTVNKIRGNLKCAAVRSPGEGDRRKAIMEDIAVLTGGRFLNIELGMPLANVKLEDLGRAQKVIVKQQTTTIVGGAGEKEDINKRIRSLQAQIAQSTVQFETERLQFRLAQLAGTVATIKVGRLSEGDLVQEKYRLESAMHSARSAIERGVVMGGGVALLQAGIALRKEEFFTQPDAEAKIAVASVLEEPILQLIENAQKSPTQTFAEILASDSSSSGFNTETSKVEDLRSAGVWDAVGPIEESLRVALSRAGSVLQTGTWDLSIPPNPQRGAG